MSICSTDSWFALQVMPRHEQRVAALLAWNGYGHFLPTLRTRKRWSDRYKIIETPLFPGYVFCSSRRDLIIRVTRGIPGVIRAVSFGGKPHPVSDEEISALQKIVKAERDAHPFPYLSTGQKVQVLAGPLAGVTGIITEFRNRDRLVISVDIIMQSVSVEIDRSEVALVDRAA